MDPITLKTTLLFSFLFSFFFFSLFYFSYFCFHQFHCLSHSSSMDPITLKRKEKVSVFYRASKPLSLSLLSLILNFLVPIFKRTFSRLPLGRVPTTCAASSESLLCQRFLQKKRQFYVQWKFVQCTHIKVLIMNSIKY